jgi:dTDP-4-amino-4,6-dideoxygalactose transaminase
MERVLALARPHDLFVVEDCAIALGATYRDVHVGLHGDIGCFSFYPVKHITTGEGGMVVTTRADVADKVSRQRAFGIDKSVLADRRHTGAYEIEHVGLNYRLSEIGAALGLVQIARLPGFLEHRRRTYRALAEGLSGVEGLRLLESDDDGPLRASHYCLVGVLEGDLAPRREAIIEQLKAAGVGTSVYYPKALPDTSYYRSRYGFGHGTCPNATRISEDSIAFPVAPHVSREDVERIVTTVKETLNP